MGSPFIPEEAAAAKAKAGAGVVVAAAVEDTAGILFTGFVAIAVCRVKYQNVKDQFNLFGTPMRIPHAKCLQQQLYDRF